MIAAGSDFERRLPLTTTLIVRIFFVGLISFTPTDNEAGEDWLALLLNAQDEYGIAAHVPSLYYCADSTLEDPLDYRCRTLESPKRSLQGTRLWFSFEPERPLRPFSPYTSFCDPDELQAPNSPECAKDHRWIVGAKRTLKRDTKRRWCCRDFWMLRACNSVSYVILEHGELQNCRFVEGGPPTLPTRAIYGLAGLREDKRSRVASEISMVKINVVDWQAGDQFIIHLRKLPYFLFLPEDETILLKGTPCGTDQVCIDILIDNRPHHPVGQTHRSLVADHFDLYRTVWGRRGRNAGKIQPYLNEGFRLPLDLQPCKADESPLLARELILAAGNERPICPENTGN